MILQLFRTPPAQKVVEQLYQRLAAGSRQPGLYRDLHVPDTPEGRFESLTLHAVLVLRRLKALPPPADDFAQDLVDILFRELDRGLRELGVGDLSVGKRIKKLAKAFYGRAASYEAALDSTDASDLGETLSRNLLGGEKEADPALIDYVRRSDARLSRLSFDNLTTGSRLFEDMP